MDLKAAICHIKRSTVPTNKWNADDFIADNCPPEAGEMESSFAAIMNAVSDGTLAQNHEGIISRLSEQVNTLITEKHADAEAIGALRDALAEEAHALGPQQRLGGGLQRRRCLGNHRPGTGGAHAPVWREDRHRFPNPG